jgi:hemerythrin-like domain-containing protein
MAEHEWLHERAHYVRAALRRGDETAARSLFAGLVGILDSHALAEERGLFAAMRRCEEYADHIDTLDNEHAWLRAETEKAATDAEGWSARIASILDVLDEHINKEEYGVFPAALASLTVAEWEAIAAVQPAMASG